MAGRRRILPSADTTALFPICSRRIFIPPVVSDQCPAGMTVRSLREVTLCNKINYKRIRQTHLVYLLFIVELATCFDPAGSSSGLCVNQVMLKNCVHLWDPIDVYKRVYIYIYIYVYIMVRV